MENLRRAIGDQVHLLVGSGVAADPDRPAGDTGLFGPQSVAWRVHGDFTTMMIGGIGALLMQMLHPAALAGIWDHSSFRADMPGRLRRTAGFIAGTTYGSTAQALGLIDRVRAIHARVVGTLPDGTAYSADDPALLTWVHVAEVDAFLRAYLRYRDPGLPGDAQDRYFAETATIAIRLGAAAVPTTRRAVEAYFHATRPALRVDRRTREAARILLSQPAPNALIGPFREIAMGAGADLLPAWAARMHDLPIGGARRHMVRAGALGIGGVLRWALRDDRRATAAGPLGQA